MGENMENNVSMGENAKQLLEWRQDERGQKQAKK